MLRYLGADDLGNYPDLAGMMFRHRADQFRTRLGWDVSVDAAGEERDTYDRCNPVYVIAQAATGGHLGSMRFLPTLGPTMLQDHFAQATGGRRIAGPHIWECTRFCLAPDAPPRTAALLMLGAAELGAGLGLSHAVGVFDARMVRIYRALGWEPEIIGRHGEGRAAIGVGLWSFDAGRCRRLALRAGVTADQSRAWYLADCGAQTAQMPRASHA